MTSKPSAAAVRGAKSRAETPINTDKLQEITAKAYEAKELELEIVDIEERLREKRADLNKLLQATLPALMIDVQLTGLAIAAKGNVPAFEIEVTPYYSANIAASWDEDKKARAFGFLKKTGNEDMIKTQVVVDYPRGAVDTARKEADRLSKKKGVAVNVKEAVSSQTLTAWLRDLYENQGKTLPQSSLELIGASVGRVTKFKKRKD